MANSSRFLKALGVLAVPLLLFGSRTVVNSQVAELATVLAGGLVGSDLVKQVEQAGSRLIDQGTASGNALLINFGNQLDLSAQDASMAMGAEANKTYANMSVDARNAMLSLSQLNDRIAALSGTPNNLEQAFFLDLRAFTAGLTGEYFYIEQIDGITQLQKESGDAYHVKIYGVGLGPPSSKIKSIVGIKINGAAVIAGVNQTSDGTAVLSIPRSILDPLFKEKEVVAVPSSFEIDQSVSKQFGRFKVWKWGAPRWHSTHYSVPFTMALVSPYAGHVWVNTTVQGFGWQYSHIERVSQVTPDYDCHHNGSDCHNPAHYHFDLQIKVPSSGQTPTQPGDQEFENVSCLCNGGGGNACLFSCGNSCPIDVMQNTTEAVCHIDTWSGSVTFYLAADAVVWQPTGTTIVTQEMDVYYGKDVSFPVPANEVLTKIKGVAPDGHPFDAVAGSDNIEGFMTARPTVVNAGVKTYIYSVPRPAGAD